MLSLDAQGWRLACHYTENRSHLCVDDCVDDSLLSITTQLLQLTALQRWSQLFVGIHSFLSQSVQGEACSPHFFITAKEKLGKLVKLSRSYKSVHLSA